MNIINKTMAGLSTVALLATPIPAQAADCLQYVITIDATASSNFGTQQAQVQQFAVVRREGFRANPFEIFFLFPGDPNAQVTPGNLELLSNAAFARNQGVAAQALDLAVTGTDANNVNRFQIIPDASFQLPPPNVLVVPGAAGSQGGLGGECFLPALQGLCSTLRGTVVLSAAYVVPSQGQGAFLLSQDLRAIQGEYFLEGAAPDNSNFRGSHQATFLGQFVGAFAC